MSDKKIDDSVSDDEDDELFSYLKTAHTVKHVKVEPIKAYEIGKSARKKFSSKSVNKSDVLDDDKVSNQRRTLRKTRQPVKSKSNIKERNRQVILLSHDGIDETLNHENDRMEHSHESNNFGSCLDLTNNISDGNHKETSVNEVDLLCGENTNFSYNERPTLNVDDEKEYPHQLNETERDLTQDFEQDVDSDAVVNNTNFTYSIDDDEHNSRDNVMPGNNTEDENCSSQAEHLCQENKYYLINERDWIKLFPSIPTNKQEIPLQEFHLPVSNKESPSKISDYGRNKNVCENEALTSKIPGNYSSSAKYNTAVRRLPVVATEAAVTRSPVKQAPVAGTQNVEVVYVRLEDGKLTCDDKNSPVKNAIVRSARKCNKSEDIRTKRSDARNRGNDDMSLGVEDNIHEASEESGNLEHGFQGRFLRINNKLTRVLHKNDQTVLEPVLSQDDELVEEKPGEVDNNSEEDGEAAFFFDLKDYNETQSGGDSDLKIYPISIQDDSYAFLQESGSVERYLARPVHLDEEGSLEETSADSTCELSEIQNSHTLHTYQRLSSTQDGKHSEVDYKIVSGKTPVKMITFSPCKLLKSPEKKTPLNKAEVISSSAQIIRNLWRNFKPDNFKQKLPGSVNSEDIIKESVKLGVSHSKEDTECIDSDSDDDIENDTLFSYLRQRKRKNTPKCNVSNCKNDEEQSSLHKVRSDKAVRNNSRSMCVQTNINDFDIELEPNRLIGKCLKNKVKKTKSMLLSTSEIHQCKDEDTALNKCKIDSSNEKKRNRKELDSNGEIDYLTENNLKKTNTDNNISRNCGKNVEKKPCFDASQGKARKEKPNSRKRKARSGNTTSEIIAKKTKVSGPEMSLSKRKERKMQSSVARTRKPKASKPTSQTQDNVTKMSSVSNQCSRKQLNVVNESNLELSDEVKSKNDGEDEIPLCTICDCNRLDGSGRTRSTKKFLESDAITKTPCKSCECKPSRTQKKKLKKCKEKSGKDNNEKEKGKQINKECAVASDKSKRKGINKRSACSNVKKSNFEKKISKGLKISDNKRKDKTNPCNIKGDNKVRKKFNGKKGVKRKQDDVIRRMEEVSLDSAEADDIRKWGNIENSKVDFLERLFHIKLKEATGPDDAIKNVSDSISSTEHMAGNGGFKHSGKPEVTADMDATDVQIQCKESERKRLAKTDDSEDYVKIHDQSDLNTNINAANAITNVETDENSIALRQSTEVVEKKYDKDKTTKVKSNICVNDIDTECVDTNISVTGSKIDSSPRMKHSSTKKKDSGSRRDKVKTNAGNRVSNRRHKNVRSLKQLHSKSKAGFKRKAENWKEHLQDKAFKFDFDKDLHKTYAPLNVKAMIRKILKPLGGSDARKRGRERDKKKFRKQKAVRIKQKMRNTSRLRVTSESDDMWMSDSGPGGSYPAFKFAVSEHGMNIPLQSSGGKTLNS